jgi:RNA polymerase sigma factor (sigma-70 family)
MDQLVDRLRKGDNRAFKELYEQSFWYCATYVMKNGGDVDDAKDVVNRAMEIFWMKIIEPDFELTCKPVTYLYSVSRNLWLKRLRKSKKDLVLQETEITGDGLPNLVEEDIYFMEDREEDDLLAICMKALNTFENTDCKQLLELYYFEKKSHKEIAEVLGIAEKYSKVKKSNCMGYLKKHVSKMMNKSV